MIRGQRTARVGLVILAVCAGLLVAEIGLRLAKGAPGTNNHHRIFCRWHPQLGWALIPDKKHRRVTREYAHVETINSLGMRDLPREIGNKAGTSRVLLLGDSFIEGYSVPDDATISRKTENLLAERGLRVEVLNGGVGGYSTDQELLWWRIKGVTLQPDVVVLGFYENDVLPVLSGSYGRGPKPRFSIDNGHLGDVIQPAPLRKQADMPPIHRLSDFLAQRSRLWWQLRGTWWRRQARAYDLSRRPPDDEKVAQAWSMVQLLVTALASEVRATGAELVILWVPPPIDQAQRHTDTRRKLTDMCTRLGLPLIDPTDRFDEANRKDPPTPTHYAEDRHWNPLGHRLAAVALATALTGILAP